METRNACSAAETAAMNTTQLRENFLIEKIFTEDTIQFTLSFFDRYITGGAMPVNKKIRKKTVNKKAAMPMVTPAAALEAPFVAFALASCTDD